MSKIPWVIGAVVGLVLGYLVGYNNIYVRQRGQVQLKQRLVAQEQADQEARQQVTELLDQIERYRQQLPPEPEPSWLVDQAVAASRQAGITLSSIAPGAPQAGKFYTRLSVGFQFSASYHQVGAFLDHLERSPNFVRVENLDVNMVRGPQGATPTVGLTLSTLYVPPANSLKAASKKPARKSGAAAKGGDV